MDDLIFDKYEELLAKKEALEDKFRDKIIADWKDLAIRLSLELECYREGLEQYADLKNWRFFRSSAERETLWLPEDSGFSIAREKLRQGKKIREGK